ncbi:hypothetical protein KIK15_17340 [Williamsia sp. CHRR-6]|nr:hypothetical protein [Williamsia sp. CHRR-6]
MKYMLIIRSTDEANAAGAEVDFDEIITAMGKYNESLVNAGVLLEAEGPTDASEGFVVEFTDEEPLVTDGPYGETHELFNGFWILQSNTPMFGECCWRRKPTWKALWGWACTRPPCSTRSRPPPVRHATTHICCSRCSPPSSRAGRRSGVWRPTAWPSRCTAAMATPRNSTSSSSTATTVSTPFTKGHMVFTAWICWAARW